MAIRKRRIAYTQERPFIHRLAYEVCKCVYGAGRCACEDGPHDTACSHMTMAARIAEGIVTSKVTNGERK